MKYLISIAGGILMGLVMAGVLFLVIRLPAGKPIDLVPAPTEAPIAVHVIGAVPRPGLYELPEGSRVQDAVDAAGGLLSEADPDAINLAAILEDGQQIDVPYGTGQESSELPELPGQPGESTQSDEAGDLVNINTAALDELDNLPGIGPTTAQNILDYRDENGPFAQIEDLLNVPGVGLTTFENIKDLITVGL
jgi:competence protein ComEA